MVMLATCVVTALQGQEYHACSPCARFIDHDHDRPVICFTDRRTQPKPEILAFNTLVRKEYMGRSRHASEIAPEQHRVDALVFVSVADQLTLSFSATLVNLTCTLKRI